MVFGALRKGTSQMKALNVYAGAHESTLPSSVSSGKTMALHNGNRMDETSVHAGARGNQPGA